MAENERQKTDIVITWVDGSDEAWLKERDKYLPPEKRSIDASPVRYRDWGLLKYLLRSIEKFAPWAGNIYIVTADQTPDFLNTSDPRVKLVFHKDFIPKEYLPTFSSRSIEFNLHRIPGLSEQFVYFNDDTLLTAPTAEEDYFKDGLPCDCHIQNVIAPVEGPMPPVLMNDMRIVNSKYSKREFIKNNRKKWFNLKYGKNVLRNLLLKKWDYFTGFYDTHVAQTLTKKMLGDLWKYKFRAVHGTCLNKFKSTSDINIWLCRYLYLASGEFVPRKMSFSRYTELSNDNSRIINFIKGQKQHMICVNDTSRCTDFENQKKLLCDAFESIFPEKSSFEK